MDTGEAPEARPTSHKLGPAGYRGCYAFEESLKVEVILIRLKTIEEEIKSPRGFKSTQLLLHLKVRQML